MESKPVAFQFTKAVKKPSVIQTSLNSTEKSEEVDFVKSVDDKGIESTKKRKEYVPLVIPLKKPKLKIQKAVENQPSTVTDTKEHDSAVGEGNLDSLAAAEILQEAAEGADGKGKGKEVADIEVASSSIVQGATIGEVPTLDDYDSVPVEEFGKALLRGMGWKDGDGTGKKGEKVGQFEAVVRPKGLGLGASVATAQQTPAAAGADGDQEELTMAPGAFVVVTIGKEKGNYGQVSSLDGDGRALVKMAVSGNTSSLPEGALRLVTKKDYKRNSRVINQEKYTEYKERQEKEHESARGRDRSEKSSSRADEAAERDSGRSKNGEKHRHRDKTAGGDKKERSSERAADSPGSRETRRPWVRPQLRVRCIDQKYKKGRYYKQKLTVVDVITGRPVYL
ncbi:G-patch domain and KOW motifs-containing protein-like [Amphibalanus amphitrite]|uniref:G-patch domain and KOW motifs-containing protein-like n=1 Tax=Amphibalanus amphitrite TaxID=1232801 RepID=UPI001C90C2FA|nr:G-patch domain and KOW motifs-containing protein-like [Amphibalanus amphitrite]XP_043194370.1 G-patch domain and KOW motifs-containing protein-like [Amphibalanus amphitrite]XP_043194371.1 G-patch domain and KOW motifs-containing protein-like [Amphibalanus amphitrite]XP_043194372.1 G-patch domain and KOW motifs-containing protein-like [Amphibalanus amphitrite]XP_043194373.1 G-patch domain and KOW motifs-containing protein-like [Amphibalanus amphitrite]